MEVLLRKSRSFCIAKNLNCTKPTLILGGGLVRYLDSLHPRLGFSLSFPKVMPFKAVQVKAYSPAVIGAVVTVFHKATELSLDGSKPLITSIEWKVCH